MRLPALLLALAAIVSAEKTPVDALLERAVADDWRTRWEAVRALARYGRQGDNVFVVRPLLLREPRPRARAAIAWACRLEPALGNATLLGLALKKDRDPAVRRAAAGALIHFKDRRAVAALVEALGAETDARTRLQIVETLRALTPAPCLLEAEAWRAWWSKHGHDPRFKPADEAPKKGEYEGIVLETRTVAPIPKRGDAKPRTPPHVLVLPQFGWTTASFGPYLLPLRERAAITWVRLPTVQQLTGRSGYGDDIPEYPVGRLVKSLDRFRAAHRVDRFVILANGASGWIAMRYAVRYPERCAGLVLLDTALDKESYAQALQYAAARGTRGERFVAKTLMHQNSVPFNEATLHKLHALGLERGFRDRADLEIAWLFDRAREPQGFASVPDIKWGRHKRIDVPSLFLYSAASAFSGHRVADRIQRNFPRSLVAPIAESTGLPYIEENDKIFKILAAFFDRFDL